MSEYQLLTVENGAGGLALRRKSVDDLVAASGAASGVENRISAPMAVFSDGAGGKNAQGLKVDIVPEIRSKGTLGPTNPRPLGGYTAAKITRAGKNLFDKNSYEKLKISCTSSSGATTGTVVGVSQQVAWIPLPGGRTYAVRCSTRSTTAFRVTATAEYPVATSDYKTPILLTVSDASANEIIFAAPESTKWIGFTLRTNAATDVTSIDDAAAGLQIEIAGAATAYEAFDGEHLDITFPAGAGTVYAGTLDVTAGTLTVTHVYMQFDGTENWTENTSGTYPYFKVPTVTGSIPKNNSSGWCSHFDWKKISNSNQNIGVDVIYGANQIVALRPGSDVATTVAGLQTWLEGQASAGTPMQVVYPLNTPVEYTLTAEAMAIAQGLNRVWADCGNVDLAYVADTKLYVDEGRVEDRGIIADTQAVYVAGRNYTTGEFLMVGATLYKATANIASGAAITPGTNVTETTVGEQLALLWAAVNA